MVAADHSPFDSRIAFVLSISRGPTSREWRAKRQGTCTRRWSQSVPQSLQSHKHPVQRLTSSLGLVNQDMLVCLPERHNQICHRLCCSLAVTMDFISAGSAWLGAGQPKLTSPGTWWLSICSHSAPRELPSPKRQATASKKHHACEASEPCEMSFLLFAVLAMTLRKSYAR